MTATALLRPNPAERTSNHDDLFRAWVAGYEQGKAERLEHDIEDAVQARLHARALEALGVAQAQARSKGPAWAVMLEEASR